MTKENFSTTALAQLSLDEMKQVSGGDYSGGDTGSGVTIGGIDGGECTEYERSLGGCRGGVGLRGRIRF